MKFFVACTMSGFALLAACRSSTNEEQWRTATDATEVAEERECTPMTPIQLRRADLALQVLEVFPPSSPMYDGALSVLPGCMPEEMKRRVTAITLKVGLWEYGLPGLPRIRLARQLGARDAAIVNDIGRAAFSAQAIPDAAFTDLRPEARSVLASFGTAARSWRAVALREMGDKDSLGTSAAQVAAASQDPSAVAAVAGLLRRLLKLESGRAISRGKAQRAVELSYAIGAASDAGRAHVDVLLELLHRNVQSFAPPFGLIERRPNEVCRALKLVGGKIAEEATRGSDCKPPIFLLPG